MIVDIYTHMFPTAFSEPLGRIAPYLGNLIEAIRRGKVLHDLDERFRIMDAFGDYRQVIALPNPPLEELTTPELGGTVARYANDALAAIVASHPDRFAAFAAALPMHDMDAAMAELDRAVVELGAGGVQIYTNVAGKPLDSPEFEPVFAAIAAHGLPIWIHPVRSAAFTDYELERRSRYQIWWCVGWPYETTAAMMRLVFSGLFDRYPGIKIITHHMGGGMVPFFDQRIGDGYGRWYFPWERGNSLTAYDDPWALAERTQSEVDGEVLSSLERPLLDYFKMFNADTALNGGVIGLRCGLEFFGPDRIVFATDAPFAGIGSTIEAVERLELPTEAFEQVCHGNAERLMKRSIR